MELKEKLIKALAELRKGKERKFDQTLDLIINLQKFDSRKNSVNLVKGEKIWLPWMIYIRQH